MGYRSRSNSTWNRKSTSKRWEDRDQGAHCRVRPGCILDRPYHLCSSGRSDVTAMTQSFGDQVTDFKKSVRRFACPFVDCKASAGKPCVARTGRVLDTFHASRLKVYWRSKGLDHGA